MEPGLLNDAKMREEVEYKIEGEELWDSVSFYVASMSWSIFGRLILENNFLPINCFFSTSSKFHIQVTWKVKPTIIFSN